MLYETLSQPHIFLFMFLGGFCSGFLFDLKLILLLKIKKKRVLSEILTFFATFLTLFLCFLLNLRFNYGEFRLFSLLAFAISFSIERFISQNFVANLTVKCYNKLKEKSIEREKRKHKKGETRI